MQYTLNKYSVRAGYGHRILVRLVRQQTNQYSTIFCKESQQSKEFLESPYYLLGERRKTTYLQPILTHYHYERDRRRVGIRKEVYSSFFANGETAKKDFF